MCWISKEPNMRVAREDKIVYKRLIPISSTKAASPVYVDHTYIKNKVCTTVNIKWETVEAEGVVKIEEGYHSYNTQSKLASYCEYYEMVIPKGTIYYQSDLYEEIVSEKLIMKRRLTYHTSPHPKIREFVDKLVDFIYGTFGRIFSKNL